MKIQGHLQLTEGNASKCQSKCKDIYISILKFPIDIFPS